MQHHINVRLGDVRTSVQLLPKGRSILLSSFFLSHFIPEASADFFLWCQTNYFESGSNHLYSHPIITRYFTESLIRPVYVLQEKKKGTYFVIKQETEAVGRATEDPHRQ